MSTRTHQQSNKPGLNTLGGFENVNFPETLTKKQAKSFTNACSYRTQEFKYLQNLTLTHHRGSLTPDELAQRHMQFRSAVYNREIDINAYYGYFGEYYAPINIALVPETILAFEKASEYAVMESFSHVLLSDIKLENSLYRPPLTTPFSEKEVEEACKQLEENERQREIMGKPTITEMMGEDVAFQFYYPDEEPLILRDEHYAFGQVEVFELFRLAQFDILNRWEQKAVVAGLRDVYADPSLSFPDQPEKSTIMDMFEANVLMLLRHHGTVNHMLEHHGKDPLCAMIDDNVMAGFFEIAQTYLYLSLTEGADASFEDFVQVYDERFYKTYSTDEMNRYIAAIPENKRRFDLEQKLDADAICYNTPSFSALQFETMSLESQAGFDRLLNKEMQRFAKQLNLPAPPLAAYFRAKSLKYEPYL